MNALGHRGFSVVGHDTGMDIAYPWPPITATGSHAPCWTGDTVFTGTPEETGTYAAATNSGAPPGIMAGGQMCRLAAAGVRGLVMFSDPLPAPAEGV
jgi:hypothetical protein